MPILLEPLIASFCQAYPEVELEIAASAELVDLAAEGFDAGIRLGQFIAADMVAVRLTPPFPFVVVGSPDYLRRGSGRSASTICVSTPACACAARTGRLRPGPLSMARADGAKLESVLEKYARQWRDTRRIDCSGPWPPYSFVGEHV